MKGVTTRLMSGGDMLEAQNRLVHLLMLGAEVGHSGVQAHAA